MKRLILGCGQTGSRLAEMFKSKNDDIITFSTAVEDAIGLSNNIQVSDEGSGRNYNIGLRLWAEKKEEIAKILEPYERTRIVYFAALGGGSGSSSIRIVLNQLTRQKNKILFVGILPFLAEAIPATANAVRSMQSLVYYQDKCSIMLFPNELIGKFTARDYTAINDHIIGAIRCVTNLNSELNDSSLYTPLSIDYLEADSIAYAGGFVNVSFSNLEEESLKFIGYGKINEAKNILVARSVYSKIKQAEVDSEANKLIEVVKKISGRARGARILFGIIRNNYDNILYITIAAGLKIGHLIDKYKNLAIDRVTNYRAEEMHEDIIDKDENKFLNV